MPDLDDRIRDLVARAVADAPSPPAIDESTALTRPFPGDASNPRARWIVGGLAGLSAAAALVALFWIGSDDLADEPATPIAPATTVAPPDSTVPDTAPDTVPDTVVDEVPTPTVPAPTEPTTEPSVAPTTDPPADAPAGAADANVVRAGPDGVVAVSVDGTVETITTEPMAVAFRVPDGRVFMQRSSDNRDLDADTTIWVVEPGSTELVGQPMPTPELAELPLRLHDVAVVGGDVVLLVESGPGRCNGFEDCDGSLWALHADTGEAEVIVTGSMWEAGFGRLHLADTGLIVGEWFAEVLSMPFSAVVPGSGASPVDFAALGLDDQYADCGTCPTAFAVDLAGSTVGWLERETDDDGMIAQVVIVLATTDGTAVDRFPLTDERTDGVSGGLVPAPWLELVNVAAGPGPSAGWLIVNTQPSFGPDPGAPASVDLDARVVVDSGLAPGTVVTAG